MLNQMLNKFNGLSKNLKLGIFAAVTVLGLAAVAPPQTKTQVKKESATTNTEVKKVEQVQPVKQALTVKEPLSINQEIPFTKSEINDGNVEAGSRVVRIVGVNGVKTQVYEVTKVDGVETSRNLVSDVITTPPVTEVTAIGTRVPVKAPVTSTSSSSPKTASSAVAGTSANCDPNYTPCIRYVPGNTLNCPDIQVRVRVIGIDHNNFDGNGDGVGCEAY